MGYYTNDAGEPIMDAAAARLEAELDDMSAFDSQFDDWDDFPDDPRDYDEEE